ncbi:MAG: hypothetical protein L3J16_03720 [Anaerolineales bacterium]|nr:hypothetical protein [Anaerolineales bacterium]
MRSEFVLQAGEKLLRKDAVSLVEGKLVSRIGMCYLSDQRIAVLSEGLLVGAFGAVSVIVRTVLRKLKRYGSHRQEIALRQLTCIALSAYGLNKAVDISLGDGSVLRMVMGAKQRQQWLSALDGALASNELKRVAESENIWRVKPAA